MTDRAADFHRLESRLRLAGVLTTRTALRVGAAGGNLEGVDLPVIKDAAGVPLLPGSSLKGALRSTVEALIRGAEARDRGIWTCDPLADGRGADASKACGHHERGKRQDADPEQHCAVCRLFGSHVLASHVRFCDGMLVQHEGSGARARLPIEVRDGVAIDRDLRRAADGLKYDFEVVSPGARFAIELFVENPRPWLLGLLLIGFDQLTEGFTAVGGFTSRGLGRVTFEWSSLVRLTARSLLQGEAPERVESTALITEMNHWRQALADRYRGQGTEVS